MNFYCVECKRRISEAVFDYSVNEFGFPLCINHQNWLRSLFENPNVSTDAIMLYLALKSRNVPAILEAYDGYKSVDISVPEARIHIEVDGGHHNYNHYQAMMDLKRTYYSFLDGYYTVRIPNALVRNNFNETADVLVELLAESRDRNFWSH